MEYVMPINWVPLFVDDVKVCTAVENVQESQLALFLQGPSDFVVSEFASHDPAPEGICCDAVFRPVQGTLQRRH